MEYHPGRFDKGSRAREAPTRTRGAGTDRCQGRRRHRADAADHAVGSGVARFVPAQGVSPVPGGRGRGSPGLRATPRSLRGRGRCRSVASSWPRPLLLRRAPDGAVPSWGVYPRPGLALVRAAVALIPAWGRRRGSGKCARRAPRGGAEGPGRAGTHLPSGAGPGFGPIVLRLPGRRWGWGWDLRPLGLIISAGVAGPGLDLIGLPSPVERPRIPHGRRCPGPEGNRRCL